MHRSGPHGEVRGILISVLGHSGPSLYGSGAGRVSIARLAETPFTRPPRRSARPQSEERSDRPDRGHGGHARSSPTQNACDGEPGSRRPPAASRPGTLTYKFITAETSYTYTLSSARAARAPCGDDVRAERAPRDRGVDRSPCPSDASAASGHGTMRMPPAAVLGVASGPAGTRRSQQKSEARLLAHA